jgi:UDP-N-acetyl-D-mannosaminuronic acid transferase (WecB/TagA/CpsF family)
VWLQAHGLEWLYRAWQEPIRLGRRYLTTNLAFLALVARERIRRPGGRDGRAAAPGEHA